MLLSDVTVLSLEHAVAAPFATRQLADLGARVIKVERPGSGDFARQYDESVNGESSYFVWLNRSKESVALDVKSPEGRAILHELADQADVIVQNLGPGAAARLGLSATDVRARIRARSSSPSPAGAATGRGPTAKHTTCWCSARPGWSP